MSIIEKAMKVATSGSEEQIIDKIIEEEKRVSASRKKDPSLLGSSRNQISMMVQERVFSESELLSKGIVHSSMKDSVLLNKYRNLRTRLLATTEKENFVTLVTSVLPQSGNSLVATNLAATFAFDEGKTSLLIDANINNPELHSILDVNSELGIIDYLESDEINSSGILYETPIPRLRLLPSGKARVNAAEYFTSEKMKDLLKDLLERYPERFPVIDAPSITQSADTRILIDLCDKVILVIPYGRCSEEEIRYAAIAIGQEKLAGVVLNEF